MRCLVLLDSGDGGEEERKGERGEASFVLPWSSCVSSFASSPSLSASPSVCMSDDECCGEGVLGGVSVTELWKALLRCLTGVFGESGGV